MSTQIEVHKGTWGGDRKLLTVPTWIPPGKSINPGEYTYYTSPNAEIAPYCEPGLMFFAVRTEDAEHLTASGASVFMLDDLVNFNDVVDYYVSESTYIRFTYYHLSSDGIAGIQMEMVDADGVIYSELIVGNYGTFYSPNLLIDGSTNYFGSLAASSKNASTLEEGKLNYKVTSRAFNQATTIQRFTNWWSGASYVGDDPYEAGGTSGTGGGTGTFSGTGDSIEFPNLPTLSAVSTGFITLFNPSIAQMQSLATYMWSDVFDIGLYKTLFADPMDCILGCSIVPVAVPNGGTKTVNVGNVSTGISMTVAASQYVEVDCGTLNVEEYWGSYLDYDPYTKAEIYLPYCGTHALQVDDIMGKAVHVKYHVDILSGACCAYVKCGSSVMYSFVGQCSSSIPISANDWTNVVNGALTIAASVGSLIATGGASAPMAVGAAAAVTGTIYGGGIKQNVEKSGSMGGTGGMLAVQTPYLILTRPRQALPKKQNTYTGYPSFITTKLENLKGYTEIDSIRITGVPATDVELNELESILKSGVIF